MNNTYWVLLPNNNSEDKIFFNNHREKLRDAGIEDQNITWKGWSIDAETWEIICTENQLIMLLLKTDAKLLTDYE